MALNQNQGHLKETETKIKLGSETCLSNKDARKEGVTSSPLSVCLTNGGLSRPGEGLPWFL